MKLRIAAEALTVMANTRLMTWMEDRSARGESRNVEELNQHWKDWGLGVFMVPCFYNGRVFGAQHSFNNDQYWLRADRGRISAE